MEIHSPPHYHISLWQDAGASARLTYGKPSNTKPWSVIKNDVYRAYWYPPDYAGLQSLDLAPGAYIEDTQDLLEWARAALISGDFGERLADSRFDIYIAEDILIYLKRHCAAEDMRAAFFLEIIPANARHIPTHMQEHGFDGRNFNFWGYDVHALDDSCITIRPLPDYPIERISTGQYTDAGRIWRTYINLNE